MPAPRPPEFRQRAVELARLREKPIAQIAKDLGISERAELVWLRRELRVKEMEIEILKRASAFFARENVLPKLGSGWSVSWPATVSTSRRPAGYSGVAVGLLRVA